ncbi:MAG: hypothetical protein ACK5LQ_02350 [Planctomycetota bacterium]|jgi:hypothetical protein
MIAGNGIRQTRKTVFSSKQCMLAVVFERVAFFVLSIKTLGVSDFDGAFSILVDPAFNSKNNNKSMRLSTLVIGQHEATRIPSFSLRMSL